MSQIPQLLVPVAEHYTAYVTIRGTHALLEKIVRKLTEYGHTDMIAASPLSHFFHDEERVRYSGMLLHFLLQHQIQSPHHDELRFLFGGVQRQFGQVEFGLITGLSFGPLPRDKVREGYMTRTGLLERYFSPLSDVTVKELGAAFERCTDVEDVLRLGLCYFMNAYLFGSEPHSKIWLESLHVADDPQSFLSYPWGHECFLRFLDGIQMKDLKKLAPGSGGDARYTVTGYSIALQYWAYETLDRIARFHASVVQNGPGFPRMLRWRASSVLTKKQIQSFYSGTMVPRQKLLPQSDAEHAYLRRETFTCSWRLVREYDLAADMATDEDATPMEFTHDRDRSPLKHVDQGGPSAPGEHRSPPVEASTHDASLRDELALLRGEMALLIGEVASLRGEVASLRGEVASLRAEQTGMRADISSILSILRAVTGQPGQSSRPPPPPPVSSSPSPSVESARPPMLASVPAYTDSSGQEQPQSEGDDVEVGDYLASVVPQQQGPDTATLQPRIPRIRKKGPLLRLQYTQPSRKRPRGKMSSRNVSVALYYGGKMVREPNGVSYNSYPKKIILVGNKISLDEMVRLTSVKLRLEKNVEAVELICRYPMSTTKTGIRYAAIRMDDDEDLHQALEIPVYFPAQLLVEMYVTVKVNSSFPTSGAVRPGGFT